MVGRALLLGLTCAFVLVLGPLAAAASSETVMAGIRLDPRAGRLRVHINASETLRGTDLVGSVFASQTGGGEPVELRIDAVVGADHPAPELYNLSMRRPGSSHWAPYCQPDQYGQRLAFPLVAEVDGSAAASRDLNFVCTSGAYGKCVMRGYPPWGTTAAGQSLRPYFEACVRMMRADYCGDGSSFTTVGRRIVAWDRAGIYLRPKSEGAGDASIEAAWGPAGALCLARVRAEDAFPLEEVLQRCPRLAAQIAPSCSDGTGGPGGNAWMWNR